MGGLRLKEQNAGSRIFRMAQVLLGTAILVFAVFTVYQLLFVQEEAGEIAPLKRSRSQQREIPLSLSYSQTQDFDYYRKVIDQRDLFQHPWEKKQEIPTQPAAAPADFSQQYRILGIILDAQPQVILEDVKSQETVFLSEGQQVDQMTVEKIQADKVIFLQAGRRIEMSP